MAVTTTISRPPGQARGHERTALSVSMVTVFVLTGSVAIANATLPAVTAEFDSTLSVAWWVVYGYLLAFAAVLPPAGRLGDRYGPDRVLLFSLVGFVVATICCALAPSMATLVASRAAQGVAAALATPQSMAILTRVFPVERRGRAFGSWGVVAGLAVAASPLLGGLAVDHIGWRWMYAVMVLVLVPAIALAKRLPPLRSTGQTTVDRIGAFLLGAKLIIVVYILLEGIPAPLAAFLGPFATPVVAIAVLVSTAWFVRTQRRASHPLLPAGVLRAPNFLLMALTTAALSWSVTGMVVLTAVQLQTVASLTAAETGLVIAIAPAVSLPFAFLSGRWTDRRGGRGPLLTGLAFMALGMAGLPVALLTGATDWPALLPGLVLFGIGMGVVFAPPGTVAMAAMPPELVGAASGAMSALRMLGSTVGTAATGTVLRLGLDRLPAAGRSAAETLTPAGDAATRQGISEAVTAAFLLPVGSLAAALLVCLFTLRDRLAGPGPDRHDRRTPLTITTPPVHAKRRR